MSRSCHESCIRCDVFRAGRSRSRISARPLPSPGQREPDTPRESLFAATTEGLSAGGALARYLAACGAAPRQLVAHPAPLPGPRRGRHGGPRPASRRRRMRLYARVAAIVASVPDPALTFGDGPATLPADRRRGSSSGADRPPRPSASDLAPRRPRRSRALGGDRGQPATLRRTRAPRRRAGRRGYAPSVEGSHDRGTAP